MRKLVFILIVFVGLLTGCKTTPGKIIASSSTTVDHAMKAWAVFVVDGHATAAQEATVKSLKEKYDAAEDAAVEANARLDPPSWAAAKQYLLEQQTNLIQMVTMFTGKKL